jgi:hypothetical protein
MMSVFTRNVAVMCGSSTCTISCASVLPYIVLYIMDLSSPGRIRNTKNATTHMATMTVPEFLRSSTFVSNQCRVYAAPSKAMSMMKNMNAIRA